MDAPAATPDALPANARRYIGVLAVGAAGVLGVAGAAAAAGSLTGSLATVTVLLVLGSGTIITPLRFHHPGGVVGFNLTIAAYLTYLLLLPDAWAVLATGLVALCGYALSTRSAAKTLFNVSQEVVWAGLATVLARAVLGGEVAGDVLSTRVWIALVLAGLAAELTNALALTELFHRLRGTRRRRLLDEMVGVVSVISVVGNLVAAVVLVLLAERSPVAVVLAAPLFGGLLIGYRGVAREQEAAGQAGRLQQTSRDLLDAAVDDEALAGAVEGLQDLFGADLAVLVLDEEDAPAALAPVVAGVRRNGTPVLSGEGDGLMAVPVVLEGRVVAVLAVAGRRGFEAWDHTDQSLLATVAGEVAATLRARLLLDQLEQERIRLATESSKLADILRSASDGIVLLDGEGRVVECNPAMTSMLGRADGDVVGRRWSEALRLHSEAGDHAGSRAVQQLTEALDHRTELAGATVTVVRPDDQLRWLRCSVAPVREGEATGGVVLVAVDLTREREVEELRSDFLATVSHELRTPLTPLSGFLAVLKKHGGDLGERRRETMVDAMEKQVARLEDLIGDLLHVADIERNVTPAVTSDVDVAEAIVEVVELEGAVPEHHRRIVVDAEPVVANGTPSAVRRIVRALVNNGLKHTDGLVVVSARQDGFGNVVVEVDDEGDGVAEWAREVIFEPFRRLGNHLHRTQGPGLGLSVARSLAEGMGGSLTVRTNSAGGASFRLTMPGAVVARDGGAHLTAVPAGGEVARAAE